MNHANTQVALITGAGRRIGAAIATHLHQVGYRVVIHCRESLTAAQLLAHNLNQQRSDSALVLKADLVINDERIQLIKDTIAWAGRLDVLVNNASIFEKASLAAEHWQKMFNIHVNAPFCLSHLAYPYLSKKNGSIINITDIHAQKPLKDYSVYCQSKAALEMQTKLLAREFAPLVRVNAVAPGAIAWPENENVLTEELQKKIIEETPLKRHGEPLFIAQAILAFINNDFITGQILAVDGGRSLG